MSCPSTSPSRGRPSHIFLRQATADKTMPRNRVGSSSEPSLPGSSNGSRAGAHHNQLPQQPPLPQHLQQEALLADAMDESPSLGRVLRDCSEAAFSMEYRVRALEAENDKLRSLHHTLWLRVNNLSTLLNRLASTAGIAPALTEVITQAFGNDHVEFLEGVHHMMEAAPGRRANANPEPCKPAATPKPAATVGRGIGGWFFGRKEAAAVPAGLSDVPHIRQRPEQTPALADPEQAAACPTPRCGDIFFPLEFPSPGPLLNALNPPPSPFPPLPDQYPPSGSAHEWPCSHPAV